MEAGIAVKVVVVASEPAMLVAVAVVGSVDEADANDASDDVDSRAFADEVVREKAVPTAIAAAKTLAEALPFQVLEAEVYGWRTTVTHQVHSLALGWTKNWRR